MTLQRCTVTCLVHTVDHLSFSFSFYRPPLSYVSLLAFFPFRYLLIVFVSLLSGRWIYFSLVFMCSFFSLSPFSSFLFSLISFGLYVWIWILSSLFLNLNWILALENRIIYLNIYFLVTYWCIYRIVRYDLKNYISPLFMRTLLFTGNHLLFQLITTFVIIHSQFRF